MAFSIGNRLNLKRVDYHRGHDARTSLPAHAP